MRVLFWQRHLNYTIWWHVTGRLSKEENSIWEGIKKILFHFRVIFYALMIIVKFVELFLIKARKCRFSDSSSKNSLVRKKFSEDRKLNINSILFDLKNAFFFHFYLTIFVREWQCFKNQVLEETLRLYELENEQ